MKEDRKDREIVLVYGRHENGGAQRQAVTLANGLAQRGYRVSLLAIKGTVGGVTKDVFYKIDDSVKLFFLPDFLEEHKQDSFIIKDRRKQERTIRWYRRLRWATKGWASVNNLASSKIKYIHAGQKVRPFVRLHSEAVYLVFGVDCYEMIYSASVGLNSRCIFVEITAPQHYLIGEDQYKQRIYSLISSADGAVFQTQEEKCCYEGWLKSNSTVIYNPLVKEMPLPHEGTRRAAIVNFCRMSPEKNIPLLIHAFEKLYKNHSDYVLEIYGNAVSEKEQTYRLDIEKIIESSTAKVAICLLPPRQDVHEAVKDAAMFVSSSDFEGLSNSMIEAMAVGLPCVCTDCLGGGAREVIRDGENGILTKAGDVDALYEGMKRFVDDPELAKQCGENAAKIRDELSTERIVQQWMTVIDEVM